MILKIQQQSAEWLSERTGRITASRVKDVMSRLKNGAPSEKRSKYLMEIVCERLTGMAAEHYVTPAMDWGSENEKHARAAYEVESGNEVDKVGMAVHPSIDCLSASPDGAIGDKGLWEGKCPTTAKHLEWMMDGEVPEEHRDQCLTQLACWEREWLDFTSYDPRLPEGLQVFTKRLERDDKRIAAIEFAVIEFDAEVNDKIDRLKGKNPFHEKLRKAAAVDAAMYITEDDLPQWAREMRS